MIKKRIIPTLTFKDVGLVKSKKFRDYRNLGDPIQALKVYNLRDVDELLFLDISEKHERPNRNLINEIMQHAFMPVTIGGGIKTIKDIEILLKAGADKVCLSSIAYESYGFIKEAVSIFGSQAIVISIDYLIFNNQSFLVFNPGYKTVQVDIIKHIKTVVELGISELILTSVDRDGEMLGYDVELLKKIEKIATCGLILNGGAGCYDHMLDIFKSYNIAGVAAASMFHYTEQTPKEAAKYLKNNLINVRV